MPLWNVANPATQRGPPLGGLTAVIDALAFSTDGKTLMTAALYGIIRLWDVAEPAHSVDLAVLGRESVIAAIISAAISPDGHLPAVTAIADTNGKTRPLTFLWNIRSACAARTPRGMSARVGRRVVMHNHAT